MLEDMPIEASQTEMQRKSNVKKQTEIQELWGNFNSFDIYLIRISEGVE